MHDSRASATAGPVDWIVDLSDVTKAYDTPAGTFTALDRVSLRARPGESIAIIGRSGSGKSTLINLIAGIDRATSGEVRVAGTRLNELSESRLTAWRGTRVGIVFQFFQLLPTLTVAENVALPMDFCATYPARERRGRALALLDQVGIADQADKLPATLSGGQQQRAAIARALANGPRILVADEPTGNLDTKTSREIMDLVTSLNLDQRMTVIMVTHEPDIAAYAERVIRFLDGRIDSDTRNRKAA